jgi:hypothetical protein
VFIFRGRGGVEAERQEREVWIDHERRKIQDSVKGSANKDNMFTLQITYLYMNQLMIALLD